LGTVNERTGGQIVFQILVPDAQERFTRKGGEKGKNSRKHKFDSRGGKTQRIEESMGGGKKKKKDCPLTEA